MTTIFTQEQYDTVKLFFEYHKKLNLNFNEDIILHRVVRLLNRDRNTEMEQYECDALNDIRTKYIENVLKK